VTSFLGVFAHVPKNNVAQFDELVHPKKMESLLRERAAHPSNLFGKVIQ